MGRYIDPNQPYTDEDKKYLRSRGRGAEIIENERRFGEDGKKEPDELERAGYDPESASFDGDDRDEATYDVGGAPLPGTVLDTDTGRVIPLSDRSDTGAFEYVDPNTGEVVEDPDAFDEDIIEFVEGLPNVDSVKAKLKEVDPNAETSGLSKRREWDDALIIALQDQRNEQRRQGHAVQPTEDDFIDPANGDEFDGETSGDDEN
ncbi:hypothetical protein SEA_THUMB_16 [Mycobacterium phage Thumb]|nr:hypothetical protein SEA_THUMB_16 [Mycobacterium phage Thumb]